MGKLKNKISLTETETKELKAILRKGKHSVRKIKRAQILLQLGEGKNHEQVAQSLGVCLATVYNIHGRFEAEKLGMLEDKPRSGQPRKVTPEVEAFVTSIACSEAPAGKDRWTISLIHDKVVKAGYDLADESVRQVLKKANSNPGSKGNGALVK
jgi:putative transposase